MDMFPWTSSRTLESCRRMRWCMCGESPKSTRVDREAIEEEEEDEWDRDGDGPGWEVRLPADSD